MEMMLPEQIGEFKLKTDSPELSLKDLCLRAIESCGIEYVMPETEFAEILFRNRLEIKVIAYDYCDVGQIQAVIRPENLNREKSVWLDIETANQGHEYFGDSIRLEKIFKSQKEEADFRDNFVRLVAQASEDHLFHYLLPDRMDIQYW